MSQIWHHKTLRHRSCHRRMKIVTKYFTFIYICIYICIYVVHAPAYASSHQTLLRKNMPWQSRSKYRTMTDALRTEEGAIVPWLMPQELRNEQRAPRRNRGFQHIVLSPFQTLLCLKRRHWQVHCILSSVQLQKAMTTRSSETKGKLQRQDRAWKSCCAGWTHVGRDNYTYLYMYTSMDI